MLTCLKRAYENESNARITLSVEISKSRKRSWNAKEVALARGYNEEDSEQLLGVRPDRTPIYKVADEPNT